MAEPAREQSDSGRYRALFELGEGGTAKVYVALARDAVGHSELVVLKTLKSHLANEPELCDMFSAEAQLSARLDHPNVVRVREVFQHGRSPVIAMEYLEGRPLSEIIQRAGEGLPLELHLWIIAEALRGLHYSHELTDEGGKALGVVHRDMTPHNVFSTYRGQVKLLDFGIAKVNASSVETETGVIKGKVRYMAPEQITGDAIDRRTDVYSCGVMLWEAATGTKLWRGIGDTTVMSRVLAGEIPKPSSVRPCTQALERVIVKALSVSPAQRHATVRELVSELTLAVPGIADISARQCGDYVRSLFAIDLQRTRERIEARLQDDDVAESDGKLSFPLSVVFDEGQATRSRTIRVKARWLVYALLAALVTAAAGVRWLQVKRAEGTARAAAPTPSRIPLQLTAFPAEARLVFDEQPLASNPATIEVAPRSRHRVRAEAPGYRSAERNIESETAIVLSLEKLVEPPPQSSSGKPRVSATARRLTPSPPVSSAVPSCEPPYFYDARGVKKYKPDCL
jgi:serine/threonine protein kinase